ncbi:hypothetical protein [Methyloversatilis sp.]|uniref:hypothetical protein n=1 Tax=Methyloversatilis sp. TaxID=2569862 RepID=UPI0035B00063
MALPLIKPDSPLAEFELLQLLSRCSAQARQRYLRFGTVWPFGVFVCPNGYVHPLESEPAKYGLPNYIQYEILHDRLVSMAWEDRLIAYALAAQIALPEELDAARTQSLRVHFESPEMSVYMYNPFIPPPCQALSPTRADRERTRFLDTFVTPANPNVFEALRR